MIGVKSRIYVIGRGFVDSDKVYPGDRVYTLDGLSPKVKQIKSVSSEYIRGKVHYVDAGQQNFTATSDSRFLYYSINSGIRYLRFSEIDELTPNKTASEISYLPVLSYLKKDQRNLSDQECEFAIRSLIMWDYKTFIDIAKKASHSDSNLIIYFAEKWMSVDPGTGLFGRANVKARGHFIKNEVARNEFAKLAVLAGYTANITPISVLVNYESIPVPGSRPKNEKYKTKMVRDLYISINADNNPIMGISDTGRVFYLPTTSILNDII